MSEIDRAIQRSKIDLLLNQPFFGNLLTYLEIKPDESIDTFCTDGKMIKYSPEFAESLTRAERTGVLAHEVMHCMFRHHLERNGRDPEIYNKAADYVVNPILTAAGLTLPAGGLYDPHFKGMTTAQVYAILYRENPPDKDSKGPKSSRQDSGPSDEKKSGTGTDTQSNEPGKSFGEVIDGPNMTADEKKEENKVWKERMAQAMASGTLAGKMPGGLARLVGEMLTPKVSWKELLWQFVQEKAKDDYSWMHPNKKYVSQGIYLPGLYSEKISSIIVAVDTSGSIRDRDISQFATEITEIMEITQTNIHVVYCDSDVKSNQEFSPGEIIELEPKGGGGTKYSPVFEWTEKEDIQPACLIYLTDGQCSDFPENEPEYPVMWITNNKYKEMPFGETVRF